MSEIVFTPSDFIASINQTLEFAYPSVVLEGELANFRVAKGRWVYFDLKDEFSQVPFFGAVYSLPGPLEDGLNVRVVGAPRMHPRFGFSINFQSILPIGEGALKKAADLLFQKLSSEGLFAPERKRLLPELPSSIGLITAADSAAFSDFIKILNERWGGLEVLFFDVYVQGQLAPLQLVEAIEHFNGLSQIPEALVLTRGGGSAEDLAAFSDERVVRAVAGSRIPTLVAIGHEVDVSLAELAADQRASTPSNAAQLLVPDKRQIISSLKNTSSSLAQMIGMFTKSRAQALQNQRSSLDRLLEDLLAKNLENLKANRRLIKIFDPKTILARGYALVSHNGKFLKTISRVKTADQLDVQLVDGTIKTTVEEVLTNG